MQKPASDSLIHGHCPPTAAPHAGSAGGQWSLACLAQRCDPGKLGQHQRHRLAAAGQHACSSAGVMTRGQREQSSLTVRRPRVMTSGWARSCTKASTSCRSTGSSASGGTRSWQACSPWCVYERGLVLGLHAGLPVGRPQIGTRLWARPVLAGHAKHVMKGSGCCLAGEM